MHSSNIYSLLFMLLFTPVINGSSISQANSFFKQENHLTTNDSSGLNDTLVCDSFSPSTEDELKEIIIKAKKLNKSISIAGMKMSQGGHTASHNQILIDMKNFNKLLQLDKINKTVRVQAGMTWGQLQDYLQPHSLSVSVMQSSNLFSIGGSLSANAHGKDSQFGPIISTVKSFRLMNDQGEILSIGKDDELFSLAIGGYGLFGIIIDVDLTVSENIMCQGCKKVVSYKKYISLFEATVKNNPHAEFHYARFCPTPGKNFLKDLLVTTYCKTALPTSTERLHPERFVNLQKALMYVYKKFKSVKQARWITEQKVSLWGENNNASRNQLMRPDMLFFLRDFNGVETDLLQEYFIPLNQFVQFTDILRSITEKHNINLLNVTLRYVPKNSQSFLSYAKEDSMAFVLYFNTKVSQEEMAKTKQYVQELIDAALTCKGSYYLTYYPFATQKQLHEAYPAIDSFWEKKRLYDPSQLFLNKFYQDYGIKSHYQ